MADKPTRHPSRGAEAASSQQSPNNGDATFSFMGSFLHTLDEKGRVSLPSSFRQQLNDAGIASIVLTNFVCDGARCLEGYALPDWERFEKKLKQRSRFDPQLRKLENYYLARAATCPLDSSGRLLIPPHLRSYAGLQKEVTFTSSLYGFRLWDQRVWEMIFGDAEAALLADPALFMDVDS